MKTILENIIAHKKVEVQLLKEQYSYTDLEQKAFFKRTGISLEQRLRSKISTNIIAEFKRQSPSKGVINNTAKVAEVVAQYEQHGAAAVSILTDHQFFGGAHADIISVREYTQIPILRKEFIIDEIQLLEAKALGADVVLLIAACLTKAEVQQLACSAQNIGLEVLLELHAVEELEHINPFVNMVGINNRNLNTFEVDIENSIRMLQQIGKEYVTIAESGIHTTQVVQHLKDAGMDGFLIGELFMQSTNPGQAFKDFVHTLTL
jgi:indole-3-glycerol phosphate synthase